MISFKDYCKRVNESTVISEDNPYMWKIEGGKGKGKEFGHKSTTVDDHLSAMNYHNAEYQKAMKEKRDSDARHHGMKYHKHKDQIERLGSAGSYLKDSVELDESASRFIQKVNQAANAAASGKHKNAQMHLDNARTFMLGVKSTDMEKIKDAHETYKNLRKKYSGSGGNFTPSHNQVGNAKVLESLELDEGAIANIEQKLKDHAKRKIDHEAKFGQMNGADLHSHEVTRTRLLQQKKKLQSAKMRAESVELDEAKLQRLPGEQDDDFLTRRDKIRAKAGTLGGIPNQKPVTRGARNSTEVRSEYSDMIYRSKKNESVELDEATFVSDSPATYGSRGAKFEVKKNKEKSVGEHANGQPKEHHDVYHEGKHVGHVASYSGYKDKKAPGARIVSSRKDVRLWQATIHGGEHNRHGSVFNTTPASSQYYHDGFTSKKDALQHLADAHNSNKNR